MTDTLRRIARIRHLEENEARRQLHEARDAERRLDDEARALLDRIHTLRNDVTDGADDLSRVHSAQLRLELARRRTERQAEVLAQRTDRSLHKLQEAARETRKAQRIAEVVEERLAVEAARADQARLDELGTRSWLRRSAA